MGGGVRAFAVLPIAGLMSCAALEAQAQRQARPEAAIHFIEQRTSADCIKAVAGAQALCKGVGSNGNVVETASFDVDGDGDLDLVVRRLSPITCGSHGCSTDIYLNIGGAPAIAEPRLVTAGPISTCAKDGARGLRASALASAPCFIFSPVNQ